MSLYIKGLPFSLREGIVLEQCGRRYVIASVNEDANCIVIRAEGSAFESSHNVSILNEFPNKSITMPDIYRAAENFTVKDYSICPHCGEPFLTEDAQYYHDTAICEDCFNEHYTKCENCGDVLRIGVDNYFCEIIIDDDRVFCEPCYDEIFTTCGDCGRTIPYAHANFMNDDYYCDSCAENYVQCTQCNHWIHERDACGDDYCAECFNNHERVKHNGLYNHWAKLPVKFHDHRDCDGFKFVPIQNEIYYGMELEMEMMNANQNSVAEKIEDFEEDDYYLESDGSLHNGIEVVFHARTRESWNGFWDALYKRVLQPAINSGCRAHNPGTCGIHIHTSLDAWDGKQLFRLFQLLYNTSAYQELLVISQRKQEELDQWASLRVEDLGKIRKKDITEKKNPFHQRYAALNITNNTLEFRLFNSSLRLDRVRKNMEFVQALYSYTKGQKSVSWGGFKLYVKRHKEKFSFLYGFMLEKDLFRSVNVIEAKQSAPVEEAA
jgi:hypothetical protein